MPDYPDIPEIAKGTVLPYSLLNQQYLEKKEKEREKRQRRHDYLLATYSLIGGAIAGAIASLIVNAITH